MKHTKKQLQQIVPTVTGLVWLNGQEACRYAGICPDTLRLWLASGLVHSRIGSLLRIKNTDIDEYIARHQVNGHQPAIDCSAVSSILSKVM
jgi:excisionase family DNA binding protein